LVQTTTSDSEGFYEIALAPGTYSVFVEDETDWYCNRSDASGGLCTVAVMADKTAEFNVRIDYAAAY
jgi:hypothetical protein